MTNTKMEDSTIIKVVTDGKVLTGKVCVVKASCSAVRSSCFSVQDTAAGAGGLNHSEREDAATAVSGGCQLSEAVLLEATATQQLGLFSDTRLRLHLVQTLLSPPASGQTMARLPAMYWIVTGLPTLLSRNSCSITLNKNLLDITNAYFHF